MSAFPQPRTEPVAGHLGRWGTDPLALMQEGAALGPVFRLRLWRTAYVGFSPGWNRLVLSDLDTFRSRGGMSRLSPYLSDGIVQTDFPDHADRRAALNPGFSRAAVALLAEQMEQVVRTLLPAGRFDAVAWSSRLVRAVLSRTFLGTGGTHPVLDDFLDPMSRPLPQPFLPRPRRFRRMDAVLAERLRDAESDSLAAVFAAHGGVPEMRVALGAGYDTTAHTLAWLLRHVALDPILLAPERHDHVVREVLRLYPAGWLGSRVTRRAAEFEGRTIPARSLVMYSPFLTHRDPSLWERPQEFCPERFADKVPAWGYLPFAAGPRTCLGRHYATLLLHVVLRVLADRRLLFHDGDDTMRAGVTLSPAGPQRLELVAA
ncbi:cytochrome P450 [Allobranchiibius sp. CTAmp26]|uniref:cytochrome P450 n=1 Tax=Allobranchiibius sp. CTAmp26 TaxID=2815214 RepID=UPI001AA18DF1|nr:cytochrome P450 [Allobranchiibius sp. CTAmp26]MBO1753952.1 cytochrome P450 [Allobranchiibius sp. CTAmp26]